MATPRSGLPGHSFEPFLFALHSSRSPQEAQAVFGRFVFKLVPSSGYGWYQFIPGTAEPYVIHARGVSGRFLDRYESEGRSRDPLFHRLAARLRTVCSDLDLSARERRGFEFQGSISSGRVARAIQAPLVVAGELIGTLNVSREPSTRPFTPGEVERLAVIARHVSIAIARTQRESELADRQRLFEKTSDLLSLPFVVSRPGGEMIFASRAAKAILDQRRIPLTSGWRATTQMQVDDRGRVAIARLPSSGEMGDAGLVVRSARLDGTGALVSFLEEPSTSTTRAEPTAVLSRREREIAGLVARGLNNVEIAAAASISRNTVKQHLKHMFEKMQVRSRAELAVTFATRERQVNSFPDGVARAPSSDAPVPPPRPARP